MPATPTSTPAKRPKNWLLIKIREWHTWLGVALAVFVVMVCLTGIYLNHKGLFQGHDHDEKEDAKHQSDGVSPLTTTMGFASLTVSPDKAMAIAREKIGDVALEKIELKHEHGGLYYKIKTPEHAAPEFEVIINASTAEATVKEKGGYKKAGMAEAGTSGGGGYDWGKIIKDLHTGKIGGEAGKLFIDFTAFVIIVLTISGVYLWIVPKMRQRKAKRDAETRNAQAVMATRP